MSLLRLFLKPLMSTKRSAAWPIVTAVIAALVVLIALPQEWKSWAPDFLRSPTLHYGLDLAGGTQLDFRISEGEMQEQLSQLRQEIATLEAQGGSPESIALLQLQVASIEEQSRTIVEAIRTVLERRINALGVSEATITPSYVGDEKHLLVDCPGVVDAQECIATIGKTIALEFKEEFTEATAEFEAGVLSRADAALRRASQSGDTLRMIGEDLSAELGISYSEEQMFFRDTLPKGLEPLWTLAPGTAVQRYEATVLAASTDTQGNPITEEVPGIFLAELTRERTQTGRLVNEAPTAFTLLTEQEEGLAYETHSQRPLNTAIPSRLIGTLRSMQSGDLKAIALEDGTSRVLFLRGLTPGREEMDVSHILIGYQGATAATADVTRTKEEALALATELKTKLTTGESFETLARDYSDGESAAEGGKFGRFGRGEMVAAFEEAAFSLAVGSISEPVETQFGYHLIRADEAPKTTLDTASYDELIVAADPKGSRAEQIMASLQKGEIKRTEDVLFARTLFFSLRPTGWKDTPLDGKHFRSATVTVDPITNIPVVQIVFDKEGGDIFRELTRRNIGKSIAIFVGGQLVSAPVVQSEILGGTAVITGSQNFEEARRLSQDLNTGAIPAPIFLSGQRTVEATLGAEALQMSLQAGLIGLILLMVYMIVFYRLLGVLADIALALYGLLFFAMLKLPLFLFSDTYIVLTLAGMAGVLLSTGMAVDANVLIFERIKEELRRGKTLRAAVETGFDRAWPSIRDGNVSTVITCAILFLIGTSIVRGFAITLVLGVLLSMFTAITVTKWMARHLAQTSLAERLELFGVRR